VSGHPREPYGKPLFSQGSGQIFFDLNENFFVGSLTSHVFPKPRGSPMVISVLTRGVFKTFVFGGRWSMKIAEVSNESLSNLNISLKEVQRITKILYYRIVLQTAHSLLMAGEKRKELSLEQRWEIINFHKLKKYIRKISEITGFKNRRYLTQLIVLKRQTVQKIYHEVVVSLC
jgi:hypothetical protein